MPLLSTGRFSRLLMGHIARRTGRLDKTGPVLWPLGICLLHPEHCALQVGVHSLRLRCILVQVRMRSDRFDLSLRKGTQLVVALFGVAQDFVGDCVGLR